jgi:hypothetical protein
MNTIFHSFLFSAFFASAAIGDNQISDLSSGLQAGGVSNLLQIATMNGYAPPRIPSKWHVEHRVKTNVEKQTAEHAREFGFRIVEALEEEDKIQRDSFADEKLFNQTMMLLDFSDWCVETAGWGNALLAHESLKLAAIASMRLTANTNFPIEKCEQIVSRLSPEWMNPRTRAEVLNNEAGTNIFALAFVDSKEELETACGAGWFLMQFANKTPPPEFRMPKNKSLNIDAVKLNLDFFEEAPSSPNSDSMRASWDYRMLGRFQGGFGYNIYRNAKSILAFRKEVGYFPEKYVRSDAEQRQLEEDIIEYAKVGIKITPLENEPSFDPVREAFRRAWNKRPNRIKGDENEYENAFMAYNKVISGAYGGREFPSDNAKETP